MAAWVFAGVGCQHNGRGTSAKSNSGGELHGIHIESADTRMGYLMQRSMRTTGRGVPAVEVEEDDRTMTNRASEAFTRGNQMTMTTTRAGEGSEEGDKEGDLNVVDTRATCACDTGGEIATSISEEEDQRRLAGPTRSDPSSGIA
ncbi:hypothetical protein ACLOJK_037946, partial [Asimina triloba]